MIRHPAADQNHPDRAAPDRRRVSPARRRPARDRVVRQYPQPQHPPRLRERDRRFHAVHRHRPAGRIPHRDPGACHRLARRPRTARTLGGSHDPAPPGGAVVAVRVSLREERRHPQSGQRRQAPEGRERRRQDAGDRRPSGPRAARGPGKTPRRRRNHQGEARPRHPVDPALSRAAARGAVQAQGQGFPATRGAACRI